MVFRLTTHYLNCKYCNFYSFSHARRGNQLLLTILAGLDKLIKSVNNC